MAWIAVRSASFLACRVKIRGGGRFISKELAEQSTLYFTYVRRHRPTSDLSHGWGHNSQWRTTFRRDYTDDAFFYYHVDGKYDLSRPDRIMEKRELAMAKFLSRAERIELLVNRCLMITQKVDDVEKHSFPYNDRYIEQKK